GVRLPRTGGVHGSVGAPRCGHLRSRLRRVPAPLRGRPPSAFAGAGDPGLLPEHLRGNGDTRELGPPVAGTHPAERSETMSAPCTHLDSKVGAKRIRVGIIGANPDRGWAAQAHIPALRSLADDFEIT